MRPGPLDSRHGLIKLLPEFCSNLPPRMMQTQEKAQLDLSMLLLGSSCMSGGTPVLVITAGPASPFWGGGGIPTLYALILEPGPELGPGPGPGLDGPPPPPSPRGFGRGCFSYALGLGRRVGFRLPSRAPPPCCAEPPFSSRPCAQLGPWRCCWSLALRCASALSRASYAALSSVLESASESEDDEDESDDDSSEDSPTALGAWYMQQTRMKGVILASAVYRNRDRETGGGGGEAE